MFRKCEDKRKKLVELNSTTNSSSSSSSLNEQYLRNKMSNKTLSELIGCKSFSNFDANDADDDDEEEYEYEEEEEEEDDEKKHQLRGENEYTSRVQKSILTGKRYSSSCNQLLKCLSNSLEEHNHPEDLSCEFNHMV